MLNISKFVEEIATLWNRLDEFTFQNSLPFAEAVLQTSFFQTACWLTEIIRVRLSKFFSSIMPSIFNKVNLFRNEHPGTKRVGVSERVGKILIQRAERVDGPLSKSAKRIINFVSKGADRIKNLVSKLWYEALIRASRPLVLDC